LGERCRCVTACVSWQMEVTVPGSQGEGTRSSRRAAIGAVTLAVALGIVGLVAHEHLRAGALSTSKMAEGKSKFNVEAAMQKERARAKAVLARESTGAATPKQALAKVPPATVKTASKLADDDCKWTYEGNLGPDNWARLCDKKYPLCGGGPTAQQSPIDIVESAIEKVNDGFTETIGWVLPAESYANFIKGGNGDLLESYNGHAFDVEHIGAFVMWGPKGEQAQYNLKHFDFHTPSEHKVNGVHYELEMHFFHELDESTDASEWSWVPHKNLVIAQFFKAGTGMGTPNWLRQLSAAAPSLTADPGQVIPVDFVAISQNVMVGTLPQNGPPNVNFRPNYENWFKYDGSLTAPPCTEGIQWVVLRNPIYIEMSDLNPIKRVEGENYRPVQPLNGRKLISNIDKWDGVDLTASGR